jgi:hypothetical protein
VGGHICIYAKRLHVVVTLNASASDFLGDVGGIKTAFLEALIAAAGPSETGSHPVAVTINQVVAVEGSGRRLLGVADASVDVHVTVSGAVSMRHLPQHLEKRAPSLHIKHVVKHEHIVHKVAHQN